MSRLLSVSLIALLRKSKQYYLKSVVGSRTIDQINNNFSVCLSLFLPLSLSLSSQSLFSRSLFLNCLLLLSSTLSLSSYLFRHSLSSYTHSLFLFLSFFTLSLLAFCPLIIYLFPLFLSLYPISFRCLFTPSLSALLRSLSLFSLSMHTLSLTIFSLFTLSLSLSSPFFLSLFLLILPPEVGACYSWASALRKLMPASAFLHPQI